MEKTKQFKDYIEEQSIEINEIDLGDKEVCDIKANEVILVEFYIKYFNEFRKIFSSCSFAHNLIERNKNVFDICRNLSSYKNRESVFGKTRKETILIRYVSENYSLITEFFDFWVELSFKKSDSISDVLATLNKGDDKDDKE